MKIKISEVLFLKERLKEINNLDLSNIEWLDENGNVVEIDPKNISDFKYMGLNNADFIDTGFYKHGF